MAKKKRLKKFSAVKAVKSAARTALGAPPAVRRVESKKRARKEKHKATMERLMRERE